MTAALTLQLKGFAEFGQLLEALATDVQEKTAWQATAAAASTVKRKSLQNARVMLKRQTGALEKNIAMVKMPRQGSEFMYGVGVRMGRHRSKRMQKKMKTTRLKQRGRGVTVDYVNDPYYWWMQHFGFTHKGGKRVGPHPFITNAMTSEHDNALAAMARKLERRLKPAGFK